MVNVGKYTSPMDPMGTTKRCEKFPHQATAKGDIHDSSCRLLVGHLAGYSWQTRFFWAGKVISTDDQNEDMSLC